MFKLPEKFVPHKYQEEAIKHTLSTPGCALFMNPGLGKTASILASIKILKNKGFVKGVLIVAPMRVMRHTWIQEAEKWLDFEDFKFITLHGKDKDGLLRKKADIYLINFEGLLWLLPILAKLKEWPFDMLVVDESTKMKAYDSKRFKFLKKVLHRFKRRIILTGTPTPNTMMDLFAQIFIVDLGASLGKYITHFRNTFFEVDTKNCKPGEPPKAWEYRLVPNGEQIIKSRIEHLVYTSNGEGFVKDQTPIINDIYVELPESARKHYRTMERILMAALENNTVLAANAAVASGKSRQIANGALYYDDQHNYEEIHSEKLDVLEDLYEELNGQPVLVWYEYKHDLERILKRFPHSKHGSEVLTASSPIDIVQRWNNKEIPILYVHHQSAGHGLNLQYGGNTMIWFSTCWSGENYDQGVARLARQGQQNRVIVHRIIARNTVDEVVIATLARKSATQEDFLAALRQYWKQQSASL